MSDLAHGTAPLIAGAAVETGADGSPRLVGSACRACGARAFPPVPVCPECLSEDLAALALSRRGTLYSFSTVHVAPRGWRVPYVAGYVDLPEGVRVFAHIVDAAPEALDMDMPVELTTAELGVDADGAVLASYAFAPAAREGRSRCATSR